MKEWVMSRELQLSRANRLSLVSLILVVRNCADIVHKSLESYKALDYPPELKELIVVDGDSQDKTLERVRQFLSENPGQFSKVTVLSNPKRSLATGWNLGVCAAEGEFVLRVDAHSEISPDYLRKGIESLLENSRIAAAGGVLAVRPRNESRVARAIVRILASRLGTGNSPFRHSGNLKAPFFSDTALFAVYRREIFSKVGHFNESLERGQDIEFHDRVLANGYKLVTDPSMTALYYAVGNMGEFISKARRTGFWAVAGGAPRRRHLIPALFVLYCLAVPVVAGVLAHYGMSLLLTLFLIPASAYLLLLFGSAFIGPKLGLYFPLLAAFHFSYGLGGLEALWRRLRKSS